MFTNSSKVSKYFENIENNSIHSWWQFQVPYTVILFFKYFFSFKYFKITGYFIFWPPKVPTRSNLLQETTLKMYIK